VKGNKFHEAPGGDFCTVSDEACKWGDQKGLSGDVMSRRAPCFPQGLAVERITHELVDGGVRALGPGQELLALNEIGERGWNALDGSLMMPVLILRDSAVSANLDVLRSYCEANNVSLAPHGKTSLAPQLVDRELRAGAWAVTVATAHQARLYRSFGAMRILMANQLIEPLALRWIACELLASPSFEFFCLVDSLEGLDLMSTTLDEAGAPDGSVQVLIELGVEGGRAGCRTDRELYQLAQAVARARSLRFRGLSAWDGVYARGSDPLDDKLGLVDALIERTQRVTVELAERGAFDGGAEVIVSVGTSAFLDRVVERLRSLTEITPSLRIVLRCGAYLTHDGMYDLISPFDGRAVGDQRLQSALELWSRVVSRPEPNMAVLNFGRRDAPYDAGLPVARTVRGRDGTFRSANGLEISSLSDHHAIIRIGGAATLEIGELVGASVSHSCAAFEKWSLVVTVDDDHDVTGAIRTFF
jgi:D-serine deaminase-like pyridoxal phosphate-dependent protein